MSPVRALLFDLYGTLVHLDDKAFQKGITRLVRAPRREWVEFLRDVLVVRPFADREAFVGAVIDRFAPRDDLPAAEALAAALGLLARELASARPEPAARSLLGFLRRRGLRLGLLTNSGSPFREPFEAAGLAECFDAALFSCDLGCKKPAPESYRAALAALACAPEEMLMIGDSPATDVDGPAAIGMPALRLGPPGRGASVERFEDLAWVADLGAGDFRPLAAPGRRVRLGELDGTLERVDLLSDDIQGRYNLVARVVVLWDEGWREEAYLKRYRHPEAVAIEEIARALLAEVGIETNRVAVQDGLEPLLLARAVTGEKLVAGAPPDPDLAFEIGRHGASAYLFANADLRPRNAFLTRQGGRPRLTMVDYEYTLFDRALDLSDLAERCDPEALARRPESELLARGSRRVVTRAAIQRTRRAFFDHRLVSAESLAAFRAGWQEVHRAAQSAAARIEELLHERLTRRPPLVIGTESYRRAFLPLDIADLRERIAGDPAAACDLCF